MDDTNPRSCPPCDGRCNQGRDCPAEQGEPVSAWPFMLASGLGSLVLVAIGYGIGWYFGGRP